MPKLIRSIGKNYIELSGEIRFETQPDNPHGGAILFYDGEREVWLPKSQIEDMELEEGSANIIVTIPEWLAEEK